MGISERPSRPKVLLFLASFVVIFGGVSWFVTGGTGRILPPPTHSHPFTGTLVPTPFPPPAVCKSDQLQLYGAFNECVAIDRFSSSFCQVPTELPVDAVFTLHGATRDYLMYFHIPTYVGAGDFGLNNGAAEVDIREYLTGAFWQSITGVLTVTGNDGRSGTVYANLTYAVGGPIAPPVLPLRVQGLWSC
jgi:hypothetical protein